MECFKNKHTPTFLNKKKKPKLLVKPMNQVKETHWTIHGPCVSGGKS